MGSVYGVCVHMCFWWEMGWELLVFDVGSGSHFVGSLIWEDTRGPRSQLEDQVGLQSS